MKIKEQIRAELLAQLGGKPVTSYGDDDALSQPFDHPSTDDEIDLVVDAIFSQQTDDENFSQDELNQIKSVLENEFEIPIEVVQRDDDNSALAMMRRIAQEYARGRKSINRRSLINRAVRGEILGGEPVLDLMAKIKAETIRRKNAGQSAKILIEILDELEKVRNEMSAEIERRYANMPGLDSIEGLLKSLADLSLNNQLDSFEDDVLDDLQIIKDDMNGDL